MTASRYVRALRSPLEAARRLLGYRRVVYDAAIFIDRPVSALGLASMHAERPEGGWRGYGGVAIERKWADIFTIDVLLTTERPALIVELGTGSGGFSCYLATYAYLNGVRFHTFDLHEKGGVTKRRNDRSLRFVKQCGGSVHRRNVFDPATVALIGRLVSRGGKAFIYCDNGDKPREIRTYLGPLKTGDLLGVHDFGSEVSDAAVAPMLEAGVCRHWNRGFFEATASSNRVFEKLHDGDVAWAGK